jgi:hypothetical protein
MEKTYWHRIRMVNKILREIKEVFGVDLSLFKKDWIEDANFCYSIEQGTSDLSIDEIIYIPRFTATIETFKYRKIILDSNYKGTYRHAQY